MRTLRDVEAYLERMPRRFSPIDDQPGTFFLHRREPFPPTVLRVDAPLVVMRVHVGEPPTEQGARLELFARLLELNASELVHGSFGLEEGRVVLTAALELENLDFNELQATLDELDLTLAQHVPQLAELSKGNA